MNELRKNTVSWLPVRAAAARAFHEAEYCD